MKKIMTPLLGILTGIVNILIGSCGGIVAVEALKLRGTNQTKSHATAIAIILPLTVISAAGLFFRRDDRMMVADFFIIYEGFACLKRFL